MRTLKNNPSVGGRKGFTLIELLVVLSILGLLASLLLPVLARARAASRRTECLGKLSQLGKAFRMFSDEHGGYMPLAVRLTRQQLLSKERNYEWAQDGEPLNWVLCLGPYLSLNLGRDGRSAQLTRPGAMRLFTCSADPNAAVAHRQILYRSARTDRATTSYGYNEAIGGQEIQDGQEVRLSGNANLIVKPSIVYVLVDAQGETESTNPTGNVGINLLFNKSRYTDTLLNAYLGVGGNRRANAEMRYNQRRIPMPPYGRRHQNGLNVLFLDGRAAFTPLGDFHRVFISPLPNE